MLGQSKRKPRGLIWARPAPGVRQPRFTRDTYLAFARQLASSFSYAPPE